MENQANANMRASQMQNTAMMNMMSTAASTDWDSLELPSNDFGTGS